VQNQWNEFSSYKVKRREYGQTLSTIFGQGKEKSISVQASDDYDDDDPIVPQLQYLDYRYIRFCYHPLQDRFMLNHSWRDPSWDDVRSLRMGLDGDEKSYRQTVFGDNVIDIEEKTAMQILVDEVGATAHHPFHYHFRYECMRLNNFSHRESRLSIHFTYSRSQVSYSGPSTSITTTLCVSLSFHYLAS